VSARIEPDAQGAAVPQNPSFAGPLLPFPAVAAIDSDEMWRGGSSLPSDHPAWMRDVVSISQRARALLVKLEPVAIRVIAFWEHRVRSIAIGNQTVSVDASGSYRCT
jgi:hypothetical protein